MLSHRLRDEVERQIVPYSRSKLRAVIEATGLPPLAIKFVASKWATAYSTPSALKISETPALTWGTGTYVTPIAFPLSSVLYGRVGVVSEFDPTEWRIFDATDSGARRAYMRWVRAQAIYPDLVLTVHSTFTNHHLRSKFRKDFKIDCVVFHPDQEAELHTDKRGDVWMLVTDWLRSGDIDSSFSTRIRNGRFTVLIDEEFDLEMSMGLPVQTSARKIEIVTASFPRQEGTPISLARRDPGLSRRIADQYANNGYVHVYVEP